MYRAPASSNGAPGFLMLIVILWAAVYLTGCSDTSTSPDIDGLASPKDSEIQLATDLDVTASLTEDVSSTMSANMTTAASVEIATATGLFDQARSELARSDYGKVRTLSDQAGEALARALTRGRDRTSVDTYVDRARQIHRRLAVGDTDDFDRPDDLRKDLGRLIDQMDDALRRGDDLTAARRAVDAHRRADRSRARRHQADPESGARLVVAMAAQAVDLANRVLAGTEIDERTQHLLDAAARLAAASSQAFQAERFRMAIVLGHKAVGLSLRAVVQPDGVTDADAEVLIGLAEVEIAAARAALEAEPNEHLQKLLERAVASFESGVELIRSGNLRGVHPVWRSAVVAAVIAS